MGELFRMKATFTTDAKVGLTNEDHYIYLFKMIEQYLNDPTSVKVATAPALPDGSPIGCGGMH
jgi:hypothetical protein